MSDYDYDDAADDDRVFPHPWERVFDDHQCEVLSETAMQAEEEIKHQQTYNHNSPRICFECLSVLGTHELYCHNCTQDMPTDDGLAQQEHRCLCNSLNPFE